MFTIDQRMDGRAVISGNDAIVFLTFPDGRRKILGNILSMTVTQKYDKAKIPILGLRNKVSRKNLGECTGTMKIHYNTSVFREAALEYQKTGKDTFYNLLVVNEDANGVVGRQAVVLKGVNFDEMPVAMIDAEAEYLTEDLPFTVNSWDLEGSFNDVAMKNA